MNPVAVVLVAAVALALVSLAFGTGLAYDPMSWEVWARELVHGSLNTAVGAPAWKPLPVFVDAAFMPFGGAVAVAAWLVVVRAAAVVGVATAAAIGSRLAGVVGGAGAAGVGSFVLLGRYGPLVAAGVSEPLCAAALLVAVWSALAHRHRTVLPALLVAALLRPEAWPLLVAVAAFGSWRWRHRPLVVLASGLSLLCVAAAWLVPDWVSTGDPLRSLHQDAAAVTGGPLHTAHPVLAVLGEVWSTLPASAWLAAAVALALLVAARSRAGAVVGVVAVEWVVVELVAVARHSSSGDARYLVPGLVLVTVLAGTAPGLVLRAMCARRPVGAPASAAAAVTAVLMLVPAVPAAARTAAAGWAWERGQTRAATVLDDVTDAGSLTGLTRCGPLSTGPYQVPTVAWAVGVPLQDVHRLGVAGGAALVQDVPRVPPERGYREVARYGNQWSWWVPRRCARSLTASARTGRSAEPAGVR